MVTTRQGCSTYLCLLTVAKLAHLKAHENESRDVGDKENTLCLSQDLYHTGWFLHRFDQHPVKGIQIQCYSNLKMGTTSGLWEGSKSMRVSRDYERENNVVGTRKTRKVQQTMTSFVIGR